MNWDSYKKEVEKFDNKAKEAWDNGDENRYRLIKSLQKRFINTYYPVDCPSTLTFWDPNKAEKITREGKKQIREMYNKWKTLLSEQHGIKTEENFIDKLLNDKGIILETIDEEHI